MLASFVNPSLSIQWKLTFSYTWVTGTTLFILALVGSVVGIESAAANFSQLMIGNLKTHTPELVPYLYTTPPDWVGITQWLGQPENLTTEVVVSDFPRVSYSVAIDGFITVVDPQGVVVASNNVGAASVGAFLESDLSEPASAVLRAALAGETDAGGLVASLPNGTAFVAYPILGPYGRIEGALVAQTTGLSQPSLLFKALLTALVLTIPVAILAALLGSLFGFFTARGYYQRFKQLALTVDQWGQGNFRAVARDASGDELGELTRRLNRMAEQFQALLHERQQLAMLEERSRLARDLHDSIKQQVFTISMLVNSARSALRNDVIRTQTCLDETDEFVQQVQQELTALVQALRPMALKEKGLVAALRELAAQWSHQSGITTRVVVEGETFSLTVAEESLFRIVQESLANVARHSQATLVTIRLTGKPDSVWLKIEDNGQGFDQATLQGRGVGLLSMRERMHSLGGTLLVTSAPGHGTHLIACCSNLRRSEEDNKDVRHGANYSPNR